MYEDDSRMVAHDSPRRGCTLRELLPTCIHENAGIDARSWHAGEAVAHNAGEDKWMLRKFKEIPKAVYEDAQECAAFMERSRRPYTA